MQYEQTASQLLDLLRDTDPLPRKADYRSDGVNERGAFQFSDPGEAREYYVIVSRGASGGVSVYGELIACEAGVTIHDARLSNALDIAIRELR